MTLVDARGQAMDFNVYNAQAGEAGPSLAQVFKAVMAQAQSRFLSLAFF